jgi:hypothetical protein
LGKAIGRVEGEK